MRNYLFIFLFVLTGCAALGLTEAKNFEQRLAYAYGTNTAVREASTSALNAGTITSKDMEAVIPLNDQIRQVLDASRAALSAGDIKTAEARLMLAVNLTTQLQTYLRTKGVKTAMERSLSWA